MRILNILIVLLVIPVPILHSQNEYNEIENESRFNYVYEQGSAGYEVYRIPAIVKTSNNVLLAFAEARKFRRNGDAGDIDLVVKRSVNNGQTWSEQVTVWDDGENSCGNPVPIVDDKGRVHLLMTWNKGEDKWGMLVNGKGIDTRRAYYTYSDDEGISWSEPKEITSDIKKTSWDWYGTGPVHGIQVKNGRYRGRLVAPNYFTIREEEKVVDYSHMVYSDDYGKNWKAGDPTPSGKVGECSVTELRDGTLLLNMRASEGNYRMQSLSHDGGITWSDPKVNLHQLDAGCQGSILAMDEKVLLSNAAANTRTNLTLTISRDDGVTWDEEITVHAGKSGYSDLVKISENLVGIFYEGGIKRYTDGLDFKIIDIHSKSLME